MFLSYMFGKENEEDTANDNDNLDGQKEITNDGDPTADDSTVGPAGIDINKNSQENDAEDGNDENTEGDEIDSQKESAQNGDPEEDDIGVTTPSNDNDPNISKDSANDENAEEENVDNIKEEKMESVGDGNEIISQTKHPDSVSSVENYTEKDQSGVVNKYEEDEILDYDSKCPTSCPARSVMVCGRCQHGVYRTFLSICHMRLFHCKYSFENLELVSRNPCMLSAPFLNSSPDLNMQPKGRVQKVADDRILRFIHCRNRAELLEKLEKGKLLTTAGKQLALCYEKMSVEYKPLI
ncbi:uncharacterized protein LOC131849044 [Achroia grisella]|uniref:uncharacterized protein LOC131849044 n=1 Tax=Achroia grisella TaxID=688607 RepID=UPI0027D3244C|nr:uncharacterized protein LOC131849044 [Achroia grisella]